MSTTALHAGWGPLVAACAEAAAALPVSQTQQMAERAALVHDPHLVASIQDRPPTPNFRTHAGRVTAAWRAADPPAGGATVAGMLLAATHATVRTRDEQSVDLVWTGPGTDTIHAQPTTNVITTLIGEARRSLVICTFASRHVPDVHHALGVAAARGVGVTLILENEDSSNGQYQPAKRDPFAGIKAEVLEWSAPQRGTVNGWTPALHAKFVLVDEETLFITSANLTGFALDHNIETGAVIRGGPLPGRLHKHLRDLTYAGVLTPIT